MTRRIFFAVLLAAATLLLYLPALRNGFVHDDIQYVTTNAHLAGGLSGRSLAWAMTTFYAANWHPLTWVSHLLDVSLFGFRPAGHHLGNLLLHALNAGLLLLILRRYTGRLAGSVVIAALFAVHPVNVQSVAWVAERKNLLVLLFWLISMAAYLWWLRRPGAGRFTLLLVVYALALTAKPMAVSLPLVLVVLDFWPLGRMRGGAGKMRLVVEKLPLFALAAVSAALTLAAQSQGEAVQGLDIFPPTMRLANAAISGVRYLGLLFLPRKLTVFYPLDPAHLGTLAALIALCALVAVNALVVRARRGHPWLLAGWCWYLVTLLPVIGIVQVGQQAMADRYLYLPCIGIFMALAGEAGSFVLRRPGWRMVGALLLAAMCVVLAWLTRAEIPFWRNDHTLFARAVAVDDGNWLAHNNLGLELMAEGDRAGAVAHYRRAIALNPRYALAHYNLGVVLAAGGDPAGAEREYRAALDRQPTLYEARHNLGILLFWRGDAPGAERELRLAVALRPDAAEAHNKLGQVLLYRGDARDAAFEFERALTLAPGNRLYAENLARARK